MMWKWNVVIGVLIGIGSVCCRVTVRPQNTVAIRGERMSLECRTTNGSLVREWSFIRPSSNPRKIEIIFSNWNSRSQYIIPRFGVDIDGSGSGILYKNETQFDDAGTYTCSAFIDEEIIKFSAEVIVLESKPVCTVREYNAGNIKTECSVGFSGNWAPKMEWRHHSRKEAHEDGTILTQEIYYNNGTHVTSKLNAAIINSAKDSFSVSCKIFFDARDHIFPSGSATNVPDFVHIWTSLVFGSTDSVPDVPARTTPSLDGLSNTMGGQSTDATRSPPVSSDMESRSYNPLPGVGGDGKIEFWYWTLILAGGGVLAIILVSLLLGIIVCVIRKRKAEENPKDVNVIYRKKTTAEKDSNIYDSILLCDDNGYVIPRQDPLDGDPRMDCLPGGPLEPYYVTTLTKQSTSNEAEKIPKSKEMIEAKTTRFEQEPAPSKLSEAKCIEAGNDKASAYLQVICDSEDAKVHERESPSSQSDETSPPYIAGYTSLVPKS